MQHRPVSAALSGPAPSLTRNTAWFVAGNVIVKPVWFAFLTFICMRLLSVEGYGVLTSALAGGALLGTLADLGTTEGATREASKRDRRTRSLLANAIGLRVVLAVGLLLCCYALVLFGGLSGTLLLGLFYALLLRMNELLRGFFKAFEVLQFEAYSVLAERGFSVALGWILLGLTGDAGGALVGMCTGTFGATLFTLYLVHRQVLPLERRLLHLPGWGAFIRRSLPLGLFQFLSLTLINLGIVLVRLSGDLTATGLYGTASRVTEALLLLPSVGIATLWPRLIRSYHDTDAASFAMWSKRLIVGYTLLAVLVTAVLFPLAPLVLRLLTGNAAYSEGLVYLQLFLVLFPLMTLKFLTSMTLLATHHQRATVVRIAWATTAYAAAAAYILFGLHLPATWVLLPLGLAFTFISAGNLLHLRRVHSSR